MVDEKGVKRRYDNSNRVDASAATRAAILDAAATRFAEIGYARTTMKMVAADAQVHVDTIYALIGRKPEMIGMLVEHSLSGSSEVVPAIERDYVAEIRLLDEPLAKLARYAAATAAMHERGAWLFGVLRDAAGGDHVARDLLEYFSRRRADNMALFVHDLGIDDVDGTVADTIWASADPQIFLRLTGERGWDVERYESWLAALWQRFIEPLLR
ncbi:MAG: TetR/AcrR family transcriptional regulator [Acidimicrobiales bacterium]